VSPTFPNARTDLTRILDAEHHHIRNGFGTEQLFNYVVDPAEHTDLALAPAHQAAVAQLRDSLARVAPRR